MSNRIPHRDWVEEKEETKSMPGWKESLLARIRATLGPWGQWADKVGFKINETQIQLKDPINSLFSYSPLNLLWVQFNTYNPVSKHPSTRVIRFGPDAAVLMVIVKAGSKMFLLARKKYQFAGKEHFIEFSRGWIRGTMKNDHGWELFERDFPGLKESPLVNSISEKPIGTPLWENNTEHSNKISHHLIVVTMKDEIGKDDLEKLLVNAKLSQEFPDESLENIDKKDLTSQPVVLEVEEAKKLLNAHLIGRETPLALFGENFSITCWSRFLALYGSQFPNLMPESAETI